MIAVHGSSSKTVTDSQLTAPLEANEFRTYVATDRLAASVTLSSLFCVVNPALGKRPASTAGVRYLARVPLPPSENTQRAGRGSRTQPCFYVELRYRGATDEPRDVDEVVVPETAMPWLLRSLRLAETVGTPFRELSSKLPCSAKFVNISAQGIGRLLSGLELIRIDRTEDVKLSALGHVVASMPMSLDLSLFFVIGLLLDSSPEMWTCVRDRVVPRS